MVAFLVLKKFLKIVIIKQKIKIWKYYYFQTGLEKFFLMVLKLIVLIIVSFYEMHDSKRDRRTLRTNEQKC